jgi:hypothetical protein
MSNLPQNIKLTIHGEEIEFSLTDKREIKYYGKTETSNESLWRTDKLEDNEVFYQTEWGWGVFVKIEERELSLEERLEIADKFNTLIREDCLTKTHHPDETEEFKLIYRHAWLDSLGPNVVPQRKLITITYNDKTIESYE